MTSLGLFRTAPLLRAFVFGAGSTALWLVSACDTLPPKIFFVCPPDRICLPPGVTLADPYSPGVPSDATPPLPEPLPPVPTGASIRPLDYGVVDAAQNPSTGALVIVSDAQELVVLDPASGTDLRTALPASPIAVSVSHDGRLAAVAYAANVSVVDLATRETTTCPAPSTVVDLTVDDVGRVYLLSGRPFGGLDALTRVDSRTCATSLLQQPYGGIGSLALTASGRTLYYAGSDLHRCRLAEGESRDPPDCAPAQQDGTRFDGCSGIWLDESEHTLLTGCGARLRLPEEGEARAYGTADGALAAVEIVSSLVVSSVHDRILVVGRSRYPGIEGDRELGVLNIHDGTTLERVLPLGLPPFPAGGGNPVARGRFVFADAPMRWAYVVMQAAADSTTPGAFALATVPLPDDGPLDAGIPATDAEVPDAADTND